MDEFFLLLNSLKVCREKLNTKRYDLSIAEIQKIEEKIDSINDTLGNYFMKDKNYRLEYLKFTRGIK